MSAADIALKRQQRPSVAPQIWIPLGIVLAALAVAPWLGLPIFVQGLVIEILMFSLLALSLNILLGYTGLVSFGHAAFFAISGYAVGAVATHYTAEILVTLPVAILCSALIAVPLGWLSIRLSGFYFLMITFAFAQMVFVAAFRWKDLTGGSDGMLVPSPTLFGISVLQDRAPFYYFTILMFFACSCAMYLVVT